MSSKEKQIHFFIPYYPRFTTGGNMYHSIVYDIYRKKEENVFVFGNEDNFESVEKSKIKKIVYGLKHTFRIPSKSVIFLSNTAFLHFLLPLFTVNFFKRHKYVILIHHLLCEENPKFLVSFFESIFVKSIKNKLTVSETTTRSLFKNKLIKDSIPIVNPGLEYNPDYSYKRRKIKPIPELLFVGNIENRKSLDTVIKALFEIRSFDFIFNIAGNLTDVDYYNRILRLIDEKNLTSKVNFLGKLSSEELLLKYRTSDLLLFPSQWEGYGMVITESMANGLPAISSDIPTSRELINNGVDGILFKKGDHEDLARCIRKLYVNPELYSKISENSILRAFEFNTWANTADKIIEFMREVK